MISVCWFFVRFSLDIFGVFFRSIVPLLCFPVLFVEAFAMGQKIGLIIDRGAVGAMSFEEINQLFFLVWMSPVFASRFRSHLNSFFFGSRFLIS